MYISGAKFEKHRSNISRDILASVFYCFNETIYDAVAFLICIIQKRQYLLNEKNPRLYGCIVTCDIER